MTEWEKLEKKIGEIPDFDSMNGKEEEEWAKKVNNLLNKNEIEIKNEIVNKIKWWLFDIGLENDKIVSFKKRFDLCKTQTL